MKQVCFLIIAALIATTSIAQSNSQKNYPALLDNYMNAAITVNQFSGSVLVAKQGNIIYHKIFGMLESANQHLLNSNSMFEPA